MQYLDLSYLTTSIKCEHRKSPRSWLENTERDIQYPYYSI